jgi:hypothetical protein
MQRRAVVFFVSGLFVSLLGCSMSSAGLPGNADAGKVPGRDASVHDAAASMTGGHSGQGGTRAASSSVGGGRLAGTSAFSGAGGVGGAVTLSRGSGGAGGSPATGGLSSTGGQATGGTQQTGSVPGSGGGGGASICGNSVVEAWRNLRPGIVLPHLLQRRQRLHHRSNDRQQC